MDFYVDVNGNVYPDRDGMEKVRGDIQALFEDDKFGCPNLFTRQRESEMRKYLSKFAWDALPKDLQRKVNPPEIILNDDGTYTFKFCLRTAI